MLQSWIDRAVSYCVHHFRAVILIALLLTAASAVYTARHFAIDTNVNNLLSAKLPWRQQEIAFHENFPQTLDIILVDVSAATPEAATVAARDVQQALDNKPDLFHSVKVLLDGDFIRLARAVYFENDERAAIKRRINVKLDSSIVEEKSYAKYKA